MTTTEIRFVIERDGKWYRDVYHATTELVEANHFWSEPLALLHAIPGSRIRRVQIETTYTLLED